MLFRSKVDPKRTLLRYLREDLRMVGTKDGCTSGDCGSCAVLVDGKRQDACTYLMRRADGVAIETIEGLASPEGKLHPIQAAYLETGGTQCGFCTPGMIMATKALLQQHPDPSEQEIREGLKDNICRCTGYVQIFEAVQQAAEWLREPRKAVRWKPTASALGSPATLVDGHLSVTGRLPYADDLFTPNMLFGAIHWSAHPYAKILSIDVAEAKAAPGVVRVIGAADVPGLNAHGRTVPDQPVFCFDYVRFVGDPIVCVLAETREQGLGGLHRAARARREVRGQLVGFLLQLLGRHDGIHEAMRGGVVHVDDSSGQQHVTREHRPQRVYQPGQIGRAHV